MSYLLFPSSGNHVTLEPEWDFEEKEELIVDEHTARQGNMYRYKWGSQLGFKFGISFVNSMTKSLVNSWWKSNTKLLFMESGGSVVHSVMIVNDSTPVGKFVKPYNDLFRGTIELSGY